MLFKTTGNTRESTCTIVLDTFKDFTEDQEVLEAFVIKESWFSCT